MLARYLLVLFFLMSVLAAPSLYLARIGNRISTEEVDPLRINLFSLANVNVDPSHNVTYDLL